MQLPNADSALTGAVLLVGGLALAPLAVVIARRMFPGRNLFFARWGFSHVLWVIVFAIFSAAFFSGVSGALLDRGVDKGTVLFGGQALMMASVCALIAFIAHRLDPDGVRCLGFRADRSGRGVAVGVVSYVLLYPALIGLTLAWPWVMERLGMTFVPQEVEQDLIAMGGASLAFAAVMVVLVLPLFEEIVFRAFLQPLLVQNLGDRGGVVLTSILFGLMHGSSAFVPIFALSLVLGFVMLRTQRIAAPWAVHALHNGLMLAVLIMFPEARKLTGLDG